MFSFLLSFPDGEVKYFQAKRACAAEFVDTCNVEGTPTSYATALALFNEGFVPEDGMEVVRIIGRWSDGEWIDDVTGEDCKSSMLGQFFTRFNV